MTSLRFARCWLNINHADRYMETVFDDGGRAMARPNQNASDVERAFYLGYGGDTWEMTLDHESLHTAVAELRGLERSIILWNVAQGTASRWPDGGQEEEWYVTAVQRYLRLDAVDKPIGWLFDGCRERYSLYPDQVRRLLRGVVAEVRAA